jgi:hypothetical protein
MIYVFHFESLDILHKLAIGILCNILAIENSQKPIDYWVDNLHTRQRM